MLRVHVSGILLAAGLVELNAFNEDFRPALRCFSAIITYDIEYLLCFIFLPLVSVHSPIFVNTAEVNPRPGEGGEHILPSPHVFRRYLSNKLIASFLGYLTKNDGAYSEKEIENWFVTFWNKGV